MVTTEVIKEIYKKFKRPPKDPSTLNLEHFINILSKNHKINVENGEVILDDLEEFNPFRSFLVRSLTAVLEFDKIIAFVFENHIIFAGKESPSLRIHIKPAKKPGLFQRIFGRD